jgi:hypothetical protein
MSIAAACKIDLEFFYNKSVCIFGGPPFDKRVVGTYYF